jgi:hypothetical protein
MPQRRHDASGAGSQPGEPLRPFRWLRPLAGGEGFPRLRSHLDLPADLPTGAIDRAQRPGLGGAVSPEPFREDQIVDGGEGVAYPPLAAGQRGGPANLPGGGVEAVQRAD